MLLCQPQANGLDPPAQNPNPLSKSHKARLSNVEMLTNPRMVDHLSKNSWDQPTKIEQLPLGHPIVCIDSQVTALEQHQAKLLEEADSKCNASLKEVWSQKEYVERIVKDARATERMGGAQGKYKKRGPKYCVRGVWGHTPIKC